MCRSDAAQQPQGGARARTAFERLRALRKDGQLLCRRSLSLLSSADIDVAAAYLDAWAEAPLADTPFATCLATVCVAGGGANKAEALFIGTETGNVHLMDAGSCAITETWHVGGAPASLLATGMLSYAACRKPDLNEPPCWHAVQTYARCERDALLVRACAFE